MRRGFVLADLAAVLVVVAGTAALIILLSGDSRRQGRLGEDIGKLRQIGGLTAEYAADNADMFWTFSWRKGHNFSQYPDLNNPTTDLQAAANQAVDILRRRAGRTDLLQITGWIPHVLYSHLPLQDFGTRVPDELFISSMDKHRLKWSRDPRGFDLGLYQPAPTTSPPGTNGGKRWPYSATFQLLTSFYDKSPSPNRITQTMVPFGAILGSRLTSDVAFPSQKVHLHDSNARHFGMKQPYATHDQARLPLLFGDGSAVVHSAVESNAGWHPNNPTSPLPMSFSYQPESWEPPTFSGGFSEPVVGRFSWTRGTATESGIAGRDFGGPETCSGQPGCP